MKVLRTLLATLLILVIVGGLGYIAYSVFFMGGMNHGAMNVPPAAAPPGQSQNTNTQHEQNGHGNTQQGNPTMNTTAVTNRDRLNQAIGTINQALDLISIDPYSKATLPDTTNNVHQGTHSQTSQGTGSVNIYPNGNTSVNIAPSGSNPPNNPTPPANTNQGNVNPPQSFVYDQGKLQQLHNGIFTLAQGIMMVNQLNDDLLAQSSMVEATPPNYQTFVARYNTAMQNKTRLNSAINLLSQASTLINVNPYAAPNGYPYNKDAMAQLHQGVYKLAQGMVMLNRLNEDFTLQMAQASAQVQTLANASNQAAANHGNMLGTGLFGTINLSTVFNIILIVLVAGLIAGILGAIFSGFRTNNRRPNGGGNPDEGPNAV